jgi:tetratricopeptide (TPR) repeat protein
VEQQFLELNRQGNTRFSHREYRQAIYTWEKARRLKPRDSSVLISIGTAYLKLADLRGAIEAFDAAAKLCPGRPEIECKLVGLLILSGDIAKAEVWLQKIRKAAPHCHQAEILRGDIWQIKDRPDLAEKSYRIAASYADVSPVATIKLAQSLLVMGKVEAAQKACLAVANTRPHDVSVLLQLYSYWKLKGDWQRAEATLKRILEIEPGNLSNRWELAQFYFERGRYEASQANMETILKADPQNSSAAIFLTEILMARGQLKPAELMLNRLAGHSDDIASVALLQGKLQLLLNTPLIAIDCFKRAINIRPNLPIAYYLLGIAYLADGQYYLASSSLKMALQLDPHFTDAELLLSDLYHAQGERDLSIALAGRVADRDPLNGRAQLLRGNFYEAAGQLDRAAVWYLKAQKLNPNSIPVAYYRAIAAEKAGHAQAALSLYEQILASDPGLADASLRYGRLLVKSGKAQRAVDYFENAIGHDAGNAYLYYILGEMYLATQQPLKGKAAFQKALALSPALVCAYDQLARLAEMSGDDQTLRRILIACIKNAPDHIPAYLMLAQSYRREFQTKKTEEILEKGLSYNPGSAWLSNSLAWVYLEEGKELDKALALAQAAYAKLPETAAICDTLGWAYYKKGCYDQALWALQAAAASQPKNNILLYHLGSAQYAAGKTDEAENNLKQALALNLDVPYKKEAESLLEKIEHPPQDGLDARWKPGPIKTTGNSTYLEELNSAIKGMIPQDFNHPGKESNP